MGKRIAAITILISTVLLTAAASGRSTLEAALDRAAFAWEAGDYIAALTTYQEIVNGPDASRAVDAIARQTGELYRSVELTRDGANPVFSPDGRRFSFETGRSIAAGDAAGVDRITHLRAVDRPDRDAATLPGGAASFCPDGRHVAWMRAEPSPEIEQAQTAIAGTTGAERTSRLQTLNALVARTAHVMLRDLDSGADEELPTGELLKTGITCAADAAVLFTGAPGNDSPASQIYSTRSGGAPQALTDGDGYKVPSRIDAAGRTLLFVVPRLSPFRLAASGTAAGQLGGANAASSFGILNLSQKAGSTPPSSIVTGAAPSLSADGRVVAWISRAGAATAAGEQRLMAASTDGLGAATIVRKGLERLDAPAVSPDGNQVAFQMMPHDDWEIFIISRDGTNEMRVTREIQHDILPRFLTNDRLMASIGEPRDRQSYAYDLPSMARTRLFHNNTVRTIAPEYSWTPSPDGTKVLILAERDGDTVSPERGIYLTDLATKVTLDDLRSRIAASLHAERALREHGTKAFAPIAADVRTVTGEISTERVYSYEKALFDFDSKHISRPGNKLASEYLFNTYQSFGYTPQYQWFSPRQALGGKTANVVATLKGTTDPDLVYVVSSHYDSVAVGPGADDDSSGTSALLETARVLAAHPMPATIVFASFTGEEAGLLGSREFVRRAVADKIKIVGALNNDMVGWANDERLDATIRYSNDGIRDIQHGAAMEFSKLTTYDARYYKGTDAASYYDAYGDIVGGIGSYPVLGSPHYHQPHDLLDTINHQQVAEVAKTTAATLMLLASSPSRITGLQATVSGKGASVSWTASPESTVTGYIVAWGPAENPESHTLRVAKPEATLSAASSGIVVRVKAINRKGLEGWDWATTTVK
jgi:hypothetical protein